MHVVVIAGGVGGARFLRGLRQHLQTESGGEDAARITAVVNVADDMWLGGLRITPDLDSIMYTLAGENDEGRGWGRIGETERVSAELAAYGLGYDWFTLGDLDLGAHIARTALLREGLPLTEVTARLCARWDIGATLLPATDEEIETRVHLRDGQDLHFQEWWVQHRAKLPADHFEIRGASTALANPRAIEAILEADRVILAPSNPVVSIGAVLAVPEIDAAIRTTSARVIGVSPVIGGRVVRGMADACLDAIGVATDAGAIARHYGARHTGGLLDAWLVDREDAAAVPALRAAGVDAHAVPLWMSSLPESSRLAQDAMRL